MKYTSPIITIEIRQPAVSPTDEDRILYQDTRSLSKITPDIGKRLTACIDEFMFAYIKHDTGLSKNGRVLKRNYRDLYITGKNNYCRQLFISERILLYFYDSHATANAPLAISIKNLAVIMNTHHDYIEKKLSQLRRDGLIIARPNSRQDNGSRENSYALTPNGTDHAKAIVAAVSRSTKNGFAK